jgi:hypothetical protein
MSRGGSRPSSSVQAAPDEPAHAKAWSWLPVAVVLAAPLSYSAARMLPGKAAVGDALEAFILEHEYCGELDSAVEDDRV